MVMTLSTALPITTLGLFAFTFLAGMWLPHGYATPFTLAPPEARASTMGVTLIFTNLIGTGLGPALAGFMSDRFGSISDALASMLIFYLTGALFLSLASWLSRTAAAISAEPVVD
jgi:MFS family permease